MAGTAQQFTAKPSISRGSITAAQLTAAVLEVSGTISPEQNFECITPSPKGESTPRYSRLPP